MDDVGAITVVVAPDGTVIDSLMADSNDPALPERFPGARFIRSSHAPRKGDRYAEAGGFSAQAISLPLARKFTSVLPDGQKQLSTEYTLTNVGDEIPLHEHPYWHDCKVLVGSVRIYDDAGNEFPLTAGQVAGLYAGKKHAIQATAPGTIIINTNEPGKQ